MPTWLVDVESIMCLKQKSANFKRAIFLVSSVCWEYLLYYYQYSLKHCSKHVSWIKRYTSVDDWWSRKSPATKDSQFYRTCVPTYLCGYTWLTNSFNKKSWIAEFARKQFIRVRLSTKKSVMNKTRTLYFSLDWLLQNRVVCDSRSVNQ